MFLRKLAMTALIAWTLTGALAFGAQAPHIPATMVNSLIIVPQKVTMTGYAATPYAVYSVYNQTNQMFLAAFSTRLDAEAYSVKLVKAGTYDSYHYADYGSYADFNPAPKGHTP